MTTFEKNQIVTCIDDYFKNDPKLPFRPEDVQTPVKGQDYTIREVVDTPYGVGIRLYEIQNSKYYFDNIKRKEEPVFSVAKFELKQ